jgi:hypothetical protein
MSDAPARVTISRTNPDDVAQRQVIVSIDGQKKGTLMFGDSVTVEIPPGPHRLRAYNTLVWKNVSFDAKPREHIQFLITNRTSRMTLGFLALMGVAPLYVTIDRITTVTAGST